jgi:hypothetical protein
MRFSSWRIFAALVNAAAKSLASFIVKLVGGGGLGETDFLPNQLGAVMRRSLIVILPQKCIHILTYTYSAFMYIYIYINMCLGILCVIKIYSFSNH